MARKKPNDKKAGKPQKGKPGAKGRKPAKRKSKRPSQDLVNYDHMKALSKQLRAECLAIFCERVASPKELAEELGQGLSQVSYHVQILRKCRLIIEDHKVPRRGAVEHFYRAATPSLVPPDTWDNLPPAVRMKVISMNILQEFFEDTAASIEGGIFEELPGELSLTPLVLDASGVKELRRLSGDFLESVLEIQANINERLRKEGTKATDAVSATVFLASFLSARSLKEAKKASARRRR